MDDGQSTTMIHQAFNQLRQSLLDFNHHWQCHDAALLNPSYQLKAENDLRLIQLLKHYGVRRGAHDRRITPPFPARSPSTPGSQRAFRDVVLPAATSPLASCRDVDPWEQRHDPEPTSKIDGFPRKVYRYGYEPPFFRERCVIKPRLFLG